MSKIAPAESVEESIVRRNVEWYLDASKWSKDVCNFKASWQQEKILKAISKKGAKVTVRSGRGIGKSAAAAMSILYFLDMHKKRCKIICTSPSAKQLFNNLWPECYYWIQQMPPIFRKNFIYMATSIRMVGMEELRFAVAATAKKENAESLQGSHAPHMLIIVDEATGVSNEILLSLMGSCTQEDNRMIMFSNPTKRSGLFYDTQTKLRDTWDAFAFSSLDSPFFKKEEAEELKKNFGEDSAVYRVHVLGEFPNVDDDVLIPLELVESAFAREIEPDGEPVAGVDVGWKGSDASALALRQGNVLTQCEMWHGLDPMQTVGKIIEFSEKWHFRRVNVDAIGLGAGVAARLKERGFATAAVNVAESSAFKERYVRLRDELWCNMRDMLQAKNIAFRSDLNLKDAIIGELTAPRYEMTSSGKYLVESKDRMKARSLKSPNLADAINLAWASADLPTDFMDVDDVPFREVNTRNSLKSWTE